MKKAQTMQKKIHANFRINLQSCDVKRMKIDRKISKAFFVIIFSFVLSIHHMIADSILIIIIISFVIHQSYFIFGSFLRFNFVNAVIVDALVAASL